MQRNITLKVIWIIFEKTKHMNTQKSLGIVLYSILCLFSTSVISQSTTPKWSATYNSGSGARDKGYAICKDASGNVYVTGEANASIPPSTYKDSKIVTRKYNSSGTLQWSVTTDGGNPGVIEKVVFV